MANTITGQCNEVNSMADYEMKSLKLYDEHNKLVGACYAQQLPPEVTLAVRTRALADINERALNEAPKRVGFICHNNLPYEQNCGGNFISIVAIYDYDFLDSNS